MNIVVQYLVFCLFLSCIYCQRTWFRSTYRTIEKPRPARRSEPLLDPPPGQRCSGRNYEARRCCTPENPCEEGEGDCDGPGDGGGHDGHEGCKGNLMCGSNNCKKFGLYFHEKDDCCEKPSSKSQQSPTEVYIPGTPLEPKEGQRCRGRNYEPGRRCCTPDEPCDEGEGDCDGPGDGGQHDGHRGCKGSLVCGTNNCKKFGAYYHEKDDCCEKPSSPLVDVTNNTKNIKDFEEFPLDKRCRGRNFDKGRCCTAGSPCIEGEGDCEVDNECSGNLVCGNNNCKAFAAFFHEKDDCCVQPEVEKIVTPTSGKRCQGRNFDKGRCCTSGSPCIEGEGDCEVDNECTGNLVCGNNNCKSFGSFFHEKDDCCIKPEVTKTVQPISGKRCRGRNFDKGRCCTAGSPCIECEGDCDVDNDCNGNLVCGNNNCKAFGSFFHEKDDCCVKPEVKKSVAPTSGKRCKGRNFDKGRCCTAGSPCIESEGDCDVDNDCSGNLLCGNNNCKAFGSFFHEKDDCCVKPPSTPTRVTPTFPLTEPYPGQRCSGRNHQARRCCTPENPCDEGEGDCDGPGDGGGHDGHQGCKGDLVCGSNNCKRFGIFYHEKDDCCEKPSSNINETPTISLPSPGSLLEPPLGQRCSGRNYQGRRCCTPDQPCNEGEGDCDGPGDGGGHDGHAGCKGELVCGSNNCQKFGAYYHEKDDCCEKPNRLPVIVSTGWAEWEAWTQCSKNCGVGQKTRNRNCTGPTCRHKHQLQERYCNTQTCSPLFRNKPQPFL